jgi:Arc/MetJ-type ribon-helix-helix transcriptional regulator
MKSNTKSSITLPAEELRLVRRLKAKLKLRTNVEVVRAGLRLLEESTEREALREQFRAASLATRKSLEAELADLDHLTGEGIE